MQFKMYFIDTFLQILCQLLNNIEFKNCNIRKTKHFLLKKDF